MASKYLQKYPIPSGFQEILADFTREVLRDQPQNIIEYGAKYFQMLEKGKKFQFDSKYNINKEDKKYELAYDPKKAEQITKKASNIAASIENQTKPEEQQEQHEQKEQKNQEKTAEQVILQVVDQLFEEYDTDKSGFLESKELEVLVKIAIERTGQDPSCIDQSHLQEFIASIDQNADGKVSKSEFETYIKMLAGLN